MIYEDEGQDEDGGITNNLGFRIVIEADDRLRVSNAQTGERYARPDEGEIHRQARERVEQQLEAMRAELEELRGNQPDS